ncbi:hypothetical protein H109_06743 [Trichophyton interdigitale MR816]|uniref:F-box domain-containing protein n=1 Tax=Trichophyton interdigitale (strain MR816) TaxID=1215338 RepID=A0A059J0W8_TRIIM|nr:hypothetical protein H101_06335 [Trichophyton interdigitale H6]KDB21318.1 hypothetical protein H109_06743 [Trichophyton interdigitale MR816]
MASAEIWASLLTAVDPLSVRAMPAMLQSTIDLLETELARARAALQELQSQPEPCYVTLQNDVTGEAMAAYRTHLLERVAASSSLSLPQSQTELRRGSGLRIKRKVSFWDIISNSLILDNLAPYLSVASLFSLASTCTALRAVIMDTPYVFRYLDLTDCKGAQLSWMPAIHGNMSAARMMEQPAADEQLYSAPLRTIFDDLNRRSVLQDVRTLILDGLPVTAELVSDILLTDRFRISLLSIRGCLYLDDHKLRQAIEYAVRPDRAKGSPSIKGIYYFSPKPIAAATPATPATPASSASPSDDRRLPGCNTSTLGHRDSSNHRRHRQRHYRAFHRCDLGSAVVQAEEPGNRSGVLANRPGCLSLGSEWYRQSGQVLKLPSVQNGWAHTLQLCQGVISFDAPLCRGARHDPNLYLMNNNNNESHQQYHQATNSQFQHPQGDIALSVTAAASGPLLPPAIATVSLGPAGCDGCRTSPEGPLVWQQSPEQHFPLLTPPPLHSYKTAVAKAPALRLDESPVLIAQCEECLRGRRCHRCNRWMCAACLPDTTKPWPPKVQNLGLEPAGNSTLLVKHQNRPFMRRDCWECGPTCLSCMMEVLRSCDACGGEYCIDHNDGCSPTKCDWCNTTTPRRMIRGLH